MGFKTNKHHLWGHHRHHLVVNDLKLIPRLVPEILREPWSNHATAIMFSSDLMGFYSDSMGFYSDLMGFYSDSMGY